MITLSAIPVSKVRDVWERVRKGLVSTLLKTEDRWIPEDVYHALLGGTAVLFMVDQDQDEIGFFVAKEWADIDGKALFIWVLYVDPNSIGRERYLEMLAQVDELAKKAGCKRIRHYSPRGWDGMGMFTLKQHIFEREV